MRTPYGDIECEYVVNCAGMWARQLGAKSGVSIPLQAAEHYYLITEPMDGVDASLPVLEDPASYGYFREEGGGLMVGLFETVCAPWNVGGIPDDFSFGEIPPDWDRMGPYLETAMARVPISMEAGVRKFFCGPESFTPDLAARSSARRPSCDNYFVAAGLNSIGILTGGGLGRVAGALDRRRPPGHRRHRASTSTGCTPTRPTPSTGATRTVESLGMVYQCHYPASLDADRARREAVAGARPARRARRLLQGRQRLGERRTGTPRAGVEPTVEPALVGTAGLVRRTGRPSTTRPATA